MDETIGKTFGIEIEGCFTIDHEVTLIYKDYKQLFSNYFIELKIKFEMMKNKPESSAWFDMFTPLNI